MVRSHFIVGMEFQTIQQTKFTTILKYEHRQQLIYQEYQGVLTDNEHVEG